MSPTRFKSGLERECQIDMEYPSMAPRPNDSKHVSLPSLTLSHWRPYWLCHNYIAGNWQSIAFQVVLSWDLCHLPINSFFTAVASSIIITFPTIKLVIDIPADTIPTMASVMPAVWLTGSTIGCVDAIKAETPITNPMTCCNDRSFWIRISCGRRGDRMSSVDPFAAVINEAVGPGSLKKGQLIVSHVTQKSMLVDKLRRRIWAWRMRWCLTLIWYCW